MNTTMKKLLSVLLAVTMMLSLGMPALATDESPVCSSPELCVDGVHVESCALFVPVGCEISGCTLGAGHEGKHNACTKACEGEHVADCDLYVAPESTCVEGCEGDVHVEGCAKYEAPKVCSGLEGCVDGAHDAECALYVPVTEPEKVCSNLEGCGEGVHVEGCALYVPATEPEKVCSNLEGCGEGVHVEGCALYVPVTEPQKVCSNLEGCVLEGEHETCMTAEEKEAADKAAAEAQLVSDIEALIAALPTEEEVQAMNLEELGAVNAQLTAISIELDKLADKSVIDTAVLAALAQVVNECVMTLDEVTCTKTTGCTLDDGHSGKCNACTTTDKCDATNSIHVVGCDLYVAPTELYVSSDYTSATPGFGHDRFNNYDAAYAYATTNSKKATIYIEKNSSVSGFCFNNKHKDYSALAVVIENGASMGNAASKWDMTYPVTVKAGGKLEMARPISASVSYIHVKKPLTIGEAGGAKAAAYFLSDSYQDGDISIRYNGKVILTNADMTVQDLDAQGAFTATDATVTVDGAFASATFYQTTLNNTTMTVGGKQITGGLSDFAEKNYDNRLGKVNMINSSVTFNSGSMNIGSAVTMDGSAVVVKEGPVAVNGNVTMNSSNLSTPDLIVAKGKKITMDDASAITISKSVENNGEIIGKLKIAENASVTLSGDGKYGIVEVPASASVTIKGGNIDTLIVADGAEVNVEISGGTFGQNVYEYIAAGYTLLDNGDGTYDVVNEVAQVGEVKYPSVAAAFAAANSGETVVVLVSHSLESYKPNGDSADIVNTKVVTLDLNGCALSSSDQLITNNGTLTIKDSASGGKLSSAATVISGSGNLTVNSGTIENTNNGAAVQIASGAQAGISGGVFIGTVHHAGAVKFIKGGSFNYVNDELRSYVMDEHRVVNDGGMWTVEYHVRAIVTNEEAVQSVFNSIEKALEYANGLNSAIVTLKENVDVDMTITGNITLTSEGFTNAGDLIVENGAKLTDSTEGVDAVYTGPVTVKRSADGTVITVKAEGSYSKGGESYFGPVTIDKDGSVAIEEGGKYVNGSLTIVGPATVDKDGNMTVEKGGSIEDGSMTIVGPVTVEQKSSETVYTVKGGFIENSYEKKSGNFVYTTTADGEKLTVKSGDTYVCENKFVENGLTYEGKTTITGEYSSESATDSYREELKAGASYLYEGKIIDGDNVTNIKVTITGAYLMEDDVVTINGTYSEEFDGEKITIVGPAVCDENGYNIKANGSISNGEMSIYGPAKFESNGTTYALGENAAVSVGANKATVPAGAKVTENTNSDTGEFAALVIDPITNASGKDVVVISGIGTVELPANGTVTLYADGTVEIYPELTYIDTNNNGKIDYEKDLNIDRDGDGKADLNVDKNGNNILDDEDDNVDTDGDGKPNYKVIKGANSTWTESSTWGVSFTVNGLFEDFRYIEIDGEKIDAKDYIARSGSTIITLKADLMQELEVGKHTIKVVFAEGSTSTNFTVKEAALNPQTGDNSNVALWAVVFTGSVVGLAAILLNKKRKNENE